MARLLLFGGLLRACVTAAVAVKSSGLSLVQLNAQRFELDHFNQSLIEEIEGSCATCVIWGDPHVITFDVMHKRVQQHPHREAFFRSHGWKEDQFTVEEEGTFWLVKNEHVHIQGRYWKNKTNPEFTSLGALAIGGPFLDGNLMVIHTGHDDILWNEKAILKTVPSNFENTHVSANYTTNSELVKNGLKGVGIDIDLPMGVKLTVNRWKQSLAAKIQLCGSLHKTPQMGQCGNNNGDVSDDIGSTKKTLVLLGNTHRKLGPDEIIFPDSKKRRIAASQAEVRDTSDDSNDTP